MHKIAKIEEAKQNARNKTLKDLGSFFRINGTNVLEIGAENFEAAEMLLDIGAKSVLCSNLTLQSKDIGSDQIRFVQLDAACLGIKDESSIWQSGIGAYTQSRGVER